MSEYEVFSGPYFSGFAWNTEIYGVNLRIQSEYRKIRTRKNSVFGYFLVSSCAKLYRSVKLSTYHFKHFLITATFTLLGRLQLKHQYKSSKRNKTLKIVDLKVIYLTGMVKITSSFPWTLSNMDTNVFVSIFCVTSDNINRCNTSK